MRIKRKKTIMKEMMPARIGTQKAYWRICIKPVKTEIREIKQM